MPTSYNRRSTDAVNRDFSFQRGTVIDPTENVKALSEAGNKRQDDLRGMEEKLVAQRFIDLEKSMHARISELKDLIGAHNTADQDSFNSVRREMSQHNSDDAREHASILTTSAERMAAMRDLLKASIDGVQASNQEVKRNLEALDKTVLLNQTNSVSTDTFNEFKRAAETRERTFNDYMLSNQGERAGFKNFWGLMIAASVGGAALVTVFQFLAGRFH